MKKTRIDKARKNWENQFRAAIQKGLEPETSGEDFYENNMLIAKSNEPDAKELLCDNEKKEFIHLLKKESK